MLAGIICAFTQDVGSCLPSYVLNVLVCAVVPQPWMMRHIASSCVNTRQLLRHEMTRRHLLCYVMLGSFWCLQITGSPDLSGYQRSSPERSFCPCEPMKAHRATCRATLTAVILVQSFLTQQVFFIPYCIRPTVTMLLVLLHAAQPAAANNPALRGLPAWVGRPAGEPIPAAANCQSFTENEVHRTAGSL